MAKRVAVVLVVLVLAICVIAGGFMIRVSDKNLTLTNNPTKDQSAPPPIRPTNFGTPTDNQIDSFKRLKQERDKLVAKTVNNFMRYRAELREFRFSSKTEKIPGELQYLYKFGGFYAEIRKNIEVHQLRPDELGISHKDVRQAEIAVYKMTLEGLELLKMKKGYTNSCLWEGGCLGNKEEVDYVAKKIVEWGIAPLE